MVFGQLGITGIIIDHYDHYDVQVHCPPHSRNCCPLPRTATQVATFTGKDWPSTVASADGSTYLSWIWSPQEQNPRAKRPATFLRIS